MRTPDSEGGSFDDCVGRFERVLVAVGTLLATAANVKLFSEQQWGLAIATLASCVIGLALYVVSHRNVVARLRAARLLRWGALAILGSLPIVTALAFAIVALAPRFGERGPIVAVAHFQGPQLPAPYQECRPSDRLADELGDVATRYGHLTAFELPYGIDPGGRWSGFWAKWHAILEGADAVVYGEYSLIDRQPGQQKPDRILVSPQVDQVPAPLALLGRKTAPLLSWQFPERRVSIDQLCTGTAQRFLADGKRLGLAIVALQAFESQEFLIAQDARHEVDQRDDGQGPSDAPCDRPGSRSPCSGVLAFYLATLDKRMGNYPKAEREYQFAAEQLHAAAPLVNLAELFAAENKGPKVLHALRAAEKADPKSLPTLATRAEYEDQYGDRKLAALYRQRALDASRKPGRRFATEYGRLVLCRAYFLSDPQKGLECRASLSQAGLGKKAEDEVEYGRWLIATNNPKDVKDGIGKLRSVLASRPGDIEANYALSRALADAVPVNAQEVRDHYLLALAQPAFTDEELTDQGNAAAALKWARKAEVLYHEALVKNPNDAYALYNLSVLHLEHGKVDLALRELRIALALHPRERQLQQLALSITTKQRVARKRNCAADTGIASFVAVRRTERAALHRSRRPETYSTVSTARAKPSASEMKCGQSELGAGERLGGGGEVQ